MEKQTSNLIYYKEYVASVHYSAKDELFYGKVEHTTETILFETDNAKQVKKEFEKAIEDYLDYCNKKGLEPTKTFKGSFNVRLTPEMHQLTYMTAIKQNISLNAFVKRAIENEIANVHKSIKK